MYRREEKRREEKRRESNFELMRIIMMIAIIAHHYVVNSEVTKMYDISNITANMIWLQVIGFAGKIMINSFILITGYFMITGKVTLKKIVKLYLEIKFYQIAIYIIFIALGMDTFSIKSFIKTVFSIIYNVNIGFTATFLFLYILIPFINLFINTLNTKQNTILLGILIFYFTIISTFSVANNTFNEISWYVVMYMIGAYIRKYPIKYDKKRNIWILSTVTCILASISSIICIDIFNNKFNTNFDPYYFVINAHKLLALLTSISLFMLFKNINIKYNKFINTVASATFGVLLIHAHSDAMRKLLWQDIFNVRSWYNSEVLWVHSIITIFTIYIVCVSIELLRIKLIEKPFFELLSKKTNFNKLANYIDNILHV